MLILNGYSCQSPISSPGFCQHFKETNILNLLFSLAPKEDFYGKGRSVSAIKRAFFTTFYIFFRGVLILYLLIL